MHEPPEITPAALVAPVRRALGQPEADVLAWTAEPLSWQDFGAGSRTLRRVTGTAHVPGSPAAIDWSLVLKTLRPVDDDVGTSEDPTSYAFWRREALIYESGLVEGVAGGLRPPRCHGVERIGDAGFVWLEDLHELYPDGWSIERFALGARHLGRFNGWWIAARDLPVQPWLASLRSIHEYWLVNPATARALAALHDQADWARVAREAGLDAPDPTALRRALEDPERLLGALERLPMTLCHNDAMAPNLFATRTADGSDETVAVDWQLAGLAPAGSELALFVAGSAWFMRVPPGSVDDLESEALAAYIDGLSDAGVAVVPDAVRFAYAASSVLRMGVLAAAWIDTLADAEGRVFAETFWGRPTSELVEAWAPVLELLDRNASVVG